MRRDNDAKDKHFEWMILLSELRLAGVGYLSHDADHVELYFTESFTFTVYTTEASVAITA